MAATLGHQADALAFFARLAEAPYRHDFYQALRRLECLSAPKPRWGHALRPVDEPIRLGQEPELSFAPASLSSFQQSTGGRPARLHVLLFGLLGPNGPLPIHLTEYARDRLRHYNDPTLTQFLDLLQHRFIALFYRAWAQAQPHVNHDRPDDDRFAVYVGAFAGMSHRGLRARDAVPDVAKLFHAGALVRAARNAEGLRGILSHFFRVPVRLQEFVGHWMVLGAGERTCLGQAGATLGGGAVIGGRVWDRQSSFRIEFGPLSLAQYEAFLPGGALLPALVAWVRMYRNLDLQWDVRLRLAGGEVPPLRLGRAGRLGWTTWLGQRKSESDADDLCLDAEAFVTRTPVSGVGVPGEQRTV
jgi:type VI secretion system protein ImpH